MKVLLVGMLDSVHVAGWLQHFVGSQEEFRIFPSGPNRRVHPVILDLVHRHPEQYSLVKGASFLGLPGWLLDKPLRNRFRGHYLKRAVKSWEPDVIHALELQNAGYLCLDSIARLSSRPKLGVTNYGSDIYWFSRFNRHRKKLIDLLKVADFYSAECARDVQLAQDLGFSGKVMPVFPNSGGVPDDLFLSRNTRPGTRDAICMKGYHGWAGRALVGLAAIEMLASKLQISTLYIHSANLVTRFQAYRLSKKVGFEIKAFAKGSLGREEVFQHLSHSLIYVGLSKTDGISTTMIEAMAAGAIPVQTSSSCCDEWFSESGVAVDRISPHRVAMSIESALELSQLREAREKNWETIAKLGLRSRVARLAQNFYALFAGEGENA